MKNTIAIAIDHYTGKSSLAAPHKPHSLMQDLG